MRRSGFFTFFLILGAISLVLDWYVFSGLRTLAADWQSRWRMLLTWGYLIISVGVLVTFVVSLTTSDAKQGLTHFNSWMLSIFLTFFVSKLVFVIVLSLGDFGRFVTGLAQNIGSDNKTHPYFPERRKFISELAVLLAAFPFTSFFYAMLRGKYDYRVHKHTLYFENLPEAFDGFTLTQISDIHSGSFDNAAAVQKGIDKINSLKSDLFVFTGDMVNNMAFEIEPYMGHFGQIKAPYGQYSVLGNHDYGDYIVWDSEQEKKDNLDKLKRHHKTMGYRLLLDENIAIEKNGQRIYLAGVENWGRDFKKAGNLDHALNGIDNNAFKILLSHDPTHWEDKVRYHKNPVQLTLSGHTHGAQFGIETAGFRWSPVQYRYLQWAGFAKHNNRLLYVNRGFGFLAFSGRLGIWPEITHITLRVKN
ncbi:metallophosphoesterase [Mucilaginibacter limnophilus]|uniref:Metallophosphoesterase n=1 Tax=Mucilaginibacter limnophilus TaxID=1932778 RepID=A0A437MG11_9SPHI|nr:metallophosphoesterase [Mucilaginibacter limnophilus]RVT96525.1 metallophosphoesterase [Mucilaginibacter limnophilus]